MKLADLEPEFLKITGPDTRQVVGAMEEADGVMFLCPACYQANGGAVGTHRIICLRPHVPQTEDPKPGRWQFQGAGLHDLTLVAGSSSVALAGGCRAHFFVRGGEIQMC